MSHRKAGRRQGTTAYTIVATFRATLSLAPLFTPSPFAIAPADCAVSTTSVTASEFHVLCDGSVRGAFVPLELTR